MRKGFLYLICILYGSLASYGQYHSSDTLFRINEKAYSSDSFLQLFRDKKLRNQNNDPLPLKDALQLYIDFQLKVTEAIQLKYDTLPEVERELESYRNLAFKNYLYPVQITDDLLRESYQRIQYFVRGRHILIKIKGRTTPKDTLQAYQRAQEVYKLLQEGKKFKKLAAQYSDDLSSRKNGGELGYITAFDMDYAFETAMYNTPDGKYSKPVRSAYGYHIVQRLDKIKNPGKVKIRHLMLAFKNGKEKTRQKADSIYQILKSGANFADMVRKYSDDTDSKSTQGILPEFGLFEIHPAIQNVAFKLKKDEISQPIKTEFGYHIIQLLDRKEYKSFKDCKQELYQNLTDNNRSRISKEGLIKNLKNQYHFLENKKLLSNFYSILDYAYADLWESLFEIDGHPYPQENFAEYLSRQASKDIYEDFKDYINRMYVNYTNKCLLDYYKKKLVQNHPKLKLLLDQYSNGVLVYFITKKTIWNKTEKDESQLIQYFKNHKEKYGRNAAYKTVKRRVLSDYRDELELKWMNNLHRKYSISINQSTLKHIANDGNESETSK